MMRALAKPAGLLLNEVRSCSNKLGFASLLHLQRLPQLPLLKTFTRKRRTSIQAHHQKRSIHAATLRKPAMVGVEIQGGVLRCDGRPLLTNVNSEELQISPGQAHTGAFLKVVAKKEADHHVITLGTLRDVRFTSCFRFKMWWMTHRIGDKGSDVASETQFLLAELPQATLEVKYAVILPLVDGSFRGSLQGSASDELQLVCETGSPQVRGSKIDSAAYIHYGSNPYETITQAVKAVEERMKTFKRRQEKQMPAFIDYFGWCTWDAFYTRVDPEGIEKGLRTLTEVGAPPGFLIIDDGWQSVTRDMPGQKGKSSPRKVAPEDGFTEADPAVGQQAACRVFSVEENSKFKQGTSLKEFIHDIKTKHSLKYVLMWHALIGYWGGVAPGLYGSAMRKGLIGPSVLANQDDGVYHDIVGKGAGIMDKQGVGEFFRDEHTYLSSIGVDGVKVDIQSAVEAYGAELGGRVAASAAYQNALGSSTSEHFPDNAVIACMSHGNDAFYHSQRVAVVRVSEDYWPKDPLSHTIHMASSAYNSLFLGEIMQPDWDMFQSKHPAAAYHAAARAVSGGPIYVSDHPGEHDPSILQKLVLPDGRVLRPLLPARPTRDCLLVDPARDTKTALKVWNVNASTGVVAAFNCQGAGWDRVKRENVQHEESAAAVIGQVAAADVEGFAELAGERWTGETVVYSHTGDQFEKLAKDAAKVITLPAKDFELFTLAPVLRLDNADFAAIGLSNLFNSGGAIRSADVSRDCVVLKVLGQGKLIAYASTKPSKCTVDGKESGIQYCQENGMLTLGLEWRAEGASVELHF